MAEQVTDEITLNRLLVRLTTLQHDSQRQIDDLRERLRIVEEDLGLQHPKIGNYILDSLDSWE